MQEYTERLLTHLGCDEKLIRNCKLHYSEDDEDDEGFQFFETMDLMDLFACLDDGIEDTINSLIKIDIRMLRIAQGLEGMTVTPEWIRGMTDFMEAGRYLMAVAAAVHKGAGELGSLADRLENFPITIKEETG